MTAMKRGTDRKRVVDGESRFGNLKVVNRVQTGDGCWAGELRQKSEGDEEGTDRRRVVAGKAGTEIWRK